jgi:hypothetical protein
MDDRLLAMLRARVHDKNLGYGRLVHGRKLGEFLNMSLQVNAKE